jgi:hypothetical protein
MIPGEHKATAGGILMPTYRKHVCRWCGACFEKEDGADHHEMQCREMVKVKLLSAALGNESLTSKGPTAVVEVVEGVMAVVAGQPRQTWDEIRV